MRVIKSFGIAVFLSALVFAANSDVEQGMAAFRDGRYSAAIPLLERALKMQPNHESARVFLALSRAAKGQCSAAMPELGAHLNSGDAKLSRLAGLAYARCLDAAGDTLGALKTARELNHHYPSDPDVLYLLAKIHMKGFNDATFQMFQHAASSYRVHELSAEIFEVQGKFDEAVDEYRKAIAQNSNAPDLHFRLGRAILMRSHSPEALAEARSAFEGELKLNPEDAATEFQLGQIAQVETKGDQAQAHLERALQLNSEFPEALVALGKLHAQRKQYGQAIDLLHRATELQPQNESAHYALMMAYRDNGQPDKAKAEKAVLDRLQRPPEGEFTEFLKKIGEKPPQQ
jgi:tetratricopeptide (TPR) repeat protein